MASRTQSFFDTSNAKGSRTRPAQWRTQDRPPLKDTSTNVTASKPPIPATSQAKSKLKAFQFVPEQLDGAAETGKVDENTARSPEVNEPVASEEQPTIMPAIPANPSSATPQLPHAHTFPCTPGTKLPLEDLIGNFDDNTKSVAPREPTPEDHIGWIPNSSSNLLTPSRKRKRARSSSPSCPNTSSQRHDALFAVAAGSGSKRTPDADPAADLWQRYATSKQSDRSNKLPDLGSLIFQLSPKRLQTPAKSGGLKRWASTGNDWPSSRHKRTRTNGKMSINVWQDQQAVDSAGRSKVAAMVEKLQESLATQKLANAPNPAVIVEAPSSSSPLPETGGIEMQRNVPSASPLQAKQAPRPSARPELPRTASGGTAAGAMTKKGAASSAQRNSDAIQHAKPIHPGDLASPAPLHLQSKAPLPAYRRPTMTRTTSGGKQYPSRPLPPPTVVPPPVAGDDFGDDDFDLTAEDLEEVMTQQPPLQPRSKPSNLAEPGPLHQQQQPNAATVSVNTGQPPTHIQQPILIDDDDDEYGGIDLDDAAIEQAEFRATQAMRPLPRRRSSTNCRSPRSACTGSSVGRLPQVKDYRRFVIKQIVDGEYIDSNRRSRPEKVASAEEERSSRTTAITIRDTWLATPIARGDIVHVTTVGQDAASDSQGHTTQITISDAESSPFLIIHPDHMLSATSVADSFDCIRKAVLQARIKATGESSKAIVYGSILHEIFQQALTANQWDDAFLSEAVERTVQSHIEGLWELGMQDTVTAVEDIQAKMGELASWARIFVAERPSDAAVIDGRQGERTKMSISKLIAIEEHIWSPRYGLKGNVDATVQASIAGADNEPSKNLIHPFEVKTGRTTQSAMHMAQTALYTLLLSDRYDVNVAAGVLYYLESSSMTRIAAPVREMRQLVQQRNRLAAYLHRAKHQPQAQTELAPQTQAIEESGLPGMLRDSYKCGKCYAQASCFAYHALAEHGSAESAGMVDDGKKNHAAVWQEAVGHITIGQKDKAQAEKLKEWFVKWDRVLTFEESDISKLRRELWTMNSAEREAAGRCFGNLIIARDLISTAVTATSSVVDGIEAGGRINRYAYVFVRSSGSQGQSFAEGTQLTVGEPIVVSSESGQWALANGYVVAVSKHDITIAVDRKLGSARERMPGFDEKDNQAFQGVMTVGRDQDRKGHSTQSRVLYRVDKDEFSNGLALVRNNLVTLMSSHPITTKLRHQIVFSSNPQFAAEFPTPVLQPSQLGEMNEDQRATVAKVLSAQEYALILGMPGTGKTTTIAHVIRALLAEEKTILLSSFTHTAVDNILLKIRDIAPPNTILRLGVPAKINPQVKEFCHLAHTPRKTIKEFDDVYMGCRIVATTCMGTNHAIFNRRAFDVCIVDEASQITLPIVLGPLLHARKFILVGDHYQLPPLVQNKAALDGGLDVSLFRQLSEEHPEAVATLGKQYRMCEEIMTLSNTLIYDGKLRCGNEQVATRQLKNVDLNALAAFHGSSIVCSAPSKGGRCWLRELCLPERRVVFANTDLSVPNAFETLSSGRKITNQLEATLSAQLVRTLLATGVPPKDIGIITLYRSQITLLRRLFKIAGISREVDIDSADRFQGRDKECIILSMVRSNATGTVGDLLKDWRRVNVALTRAKSKLVVFGSKQTLANNELLAEMLALMDVREWALDLPAAAENFHSFDFGTQAASDIMVQDTPTPVKVSTTAARALIPTQGSPKGIQTVTARVLQESKSAANRSPARISTTRAPGKIVTGRRGGKAAKMMEQEAFAIFEDLTNDDL